MTTNVEAGLPATVWRVEKATGDRAAEGEIILILESMKMEIPIEAPVAGTIRVLVGEGASVVDDTVVAEID